MHPDQTAALRLTCAPAIPPILADEVRALGYEPQLVDDTGVELSATVRDAMRLNLHLRTAISVLQQLHDFECRGPQELYDGCYEVAWEEIVPPDGYVSVVSRGAHPSIDNWMFVNQRVKDAIVDRMSDRVGVRPQSGPLRRGLVIDVFWRADRCRVYLNTSGQKLADRGYRRMAHKAPMQETLAAAVLLAAGYDGSQPLVNPMCGSGTLAIEAALIALNRAPGLLRGNFGLMHVKDFDRDAWEALRRDAAKARKKTAAAPIIASDHDPRALAAASQNAKTAGVDYLVRFEACDFAETTVPPGGGIVLLNPEYGERVGDVAALAETYARIGDFFKQKCAGCCGYVFTGNRELAKRIGLHAARRMVFWNAKIECRLLKFELYAGTRRKDKQPPLPT